MRGITRWIAVISCALAGGCTLTPGYTDTLPDVPPMFVPAPPPSRRPGLPLVVIGVGAIPNQIDGTSESFSFYQYLASHPMHCRAADVEVRLVDAPIDADYFVSGRVEGKIGYKQESSSGAMLGILLGVEGVVEGSVVGALGASGHSEITERIGIGGGAAFLLAGAFTAIGGALRPHHRYGWTVTGRFVISRKGTAEAEPAFHIDGGAHTRQAIARLHARVLDPVFRALEGQLASRIDADYAETGL